MPIALSAIFWLATCGNAAAYAGMGAALGLVGSTIALIATLVFCLCMVLAWPVIHILRKRRLRKQEQKPPASPE